MGVWIFDSREISKVNSPGHAEFSLTHQIFAHSCLFCVPGEFFGISRYTKQAADSIP